MTSPADWIVDDVDRELFARDLASFVPDHIFDAHAHWYAAEHFPADARPGLVASGPSVAGYATYRRQMEELLPGRSATQGLFFPFPHARVDVAAANAFLVDELQHAPGALGQMLITPATSPDVIRDAVARRRIVGLKCYHVYSPRTPTFDSPIEEYLSEDQAAVAHELGLSITLHIVRARALADVVNQRTIINWCRKYPNMRLILAHAARGFNPHHTIEGVAALQGLDNVWFDTSVVCDSGAIEAIARTMGHEKILYGSDYPVTHLRGRCVALGDTFFWISADNTKLDVPYADLRLALVGHEALRTLKVAAIALGWTDSQIEDVFFGNAARLYDLQENGP
jgi:predicted TIM-barrel fold metal-dependent hydrolase